jgi:hypothetical protein
MSSHDDGNTPRVPELPDSVNPQPADPEESASPSNAFTSSFLGRLQGRDEPPAASEADWAGPWRMEVMPEGDFGLFRMGESEERGYQPFMRFGRMSDALLGMALLTGRREPEHRLVSAPDGHGHLLQSRSAWGEAVGWMAVFDDDLVARLSCLDGLMRSPQALALFLEACGKVILERAGAILDERVRTAVR